MAYDAADILSLILLLTWTCFTTTPDRRKHHVFKKVLASKEIFQELCSSASLSFAPGLLEVLKSATPPTVAFFKTLPTEFSTKRWAIYLLVLEKRHCRPKIYVGTGTAAKRGIRARMSNYDEGT